MVLLKPRESAEFVDYARGAPRHSVVIHGSYSRANGREWWIEPADGSQAYRLDFGLPAAVGDWVFDSDRSAPRRALLAKEDFFSDLTIYRHSEKRDEVFRLLYDPRDVRKS